MAKLSFYLDCRHPVDGRGAVRIRVEALHSSTMIDTGLKLKPDEWDASSRRPLAKAARARFDTLAGRLDAMMFELKASGRLANLGAKELAALVRSEVFSESDTDGFLRYAEKFAAFRRTPGTREVYGRSISALRRYDPLLEETSFGRMDSRYLEGFEKFLLASGVGVNTISIYMRCMRTVFNAAIADGVTDNYPFRRYHIRQEETRKRALSIQELRELFAFEPSEGWQKEYLDYFKLTFYLIGINSADLLGARKTDLYGGRLHYRRAKTGRWYSVKVEPEAMEIISHYSGTEHLLAPLDGRYSDDGNYLQHVNRGLQALGRPLGKKGKVLGEGRWPYLTTYWARHSWATAAYELGVSVDVIAQALGHADRSHAVTAIYIRPDQRKVDEANRKVIDAVVGPE